MRIFVTGASGLIGHAVARALRRAGHEVHGLVRSAAKARALEAGEIVPVQGTLQDPSAWAKAAESASVLVHAAADYTQDVFALDRKAVEALLHACRRGPRPKTLIYTSGVWVLGNTGTAAVDETAPTNPLTMVRPRVAIEELVLGASQARGVVIRPGCVYGGTGGMTGSWFQAAHDGKGVQVVGDGANRWAMIHLDDLADGYLRAAESGLGGEIFHLTDRSRATLLENVTAAARAAGYGGPVEHVPYGDAVKAMGAFAEAIAVDQHVDSRKAVRLLGWQPRHGGFRDGAETYYRAWWAARG